MCLRLKLIRHMWEASLLDVRLSKTVRHNQSGQYLLIQYLLLRAICGSPVERKAQ